MRLLDLVVSVEHGSEGICPECGGCCPDVEFDATVKGSLGHKPGCELLALKNDLIKESWRYVYANWIFPRVSMNSAFNISNFKPKE